jgi:5-methylcytosine-specific restriction endonuclease McrA
MSIKQWAAYIGVEYKTFWMRLRDGMPYEKAFSKTVERAPVKRNPEKTITKMCLNCAAAFTIPKSRDWREHCCSSSCKIEHGEKRREAFRLSRTRECKHCGTSFIAKKSQLDEGGGNYCSVECHRAVFGVAHMNTEEVQARARAKLLELRKAGKIRYYRGAESPCWKGGKEASNQRNAHKKREWSRRWLAANKEWVRERADRRTKLKGGKRLPRGTVKRLLEAQRNKCPICRKPLRGKYHIDHVVPLARGGQHEALNIQILCPTCNVRKSAKDPIQYMQERGFLL